jgi:hypothetical protein
VRIALPDNDAHAKQSLTFWKAAPMFTTGRTESAQHVKTKNMVTIEDLSDTALPDTVQEDTYVDPAEKHQQLGIDAFVKLCCLMFCFV